MSRILEMTRSFFGPPPRAIDWPIEPPPWLGANDWLGAAYREHGRLLNHGHVVMGHVVQANAAIFRAGTEICASLVLHPRDPSLVFEMDEMERAAQAIFGIRGKKPMDADQAQLADLLENELQRCFSVPVPPALCKARPLFVSCALLYRQALPGGYLATSLLPTLVCADIAQIAPLPALYWAADFVNAWKDLET